VRDQIAETGLDARPDDAQRIAALGSPRRGVPVLWERVSPADPHERDYREPQRRLDALRAVGSNRSSRCCITVAVRRIPTCSSGVSAVVRRVCRSDGAGVSVGARWTPINEPLTTARFATLYGVWYPNMRDDRGFGRAMVNQTLAQQAAMRRIRRVIPDAEFVLTEDLQRYAAGDAGVADYVAFLRERVYLSVELVAGRVAEGMRWRPSSPNAAGERARARDDGSATRPCPISWRSTTTRTRSAISHARRRGRGRAGRLRRGEPPRRPGRCCVPRRAAASAAGAGEVHAPRARARARALARAARGRRAATAREGVDVRALGAWAAFGMVDWHSLCATARG